MTIDEQIKEQNKALLVSVYKGTNNREICEEHLEELALLAETFGVEVVGKEPCHTRKYDASTFVTEGKLEMLISKAHELKADVVIFDDEIAPSQQRNLEKLFKLPVMDRTGVILGCLFRGPKQRKRASKSSWRR